METCEYIVHKLLQYKIHQYRIVENTQKSMLYKDVFNKIEYETTLTTEIFVLFNIQDKFATFTITPNVCNELIDIIIEKSVRHACSLDFKICDNKVKSLESSSQLEYEFNTFNTDCYIKQISDELEKVRKSTSLTLNTVLNMNIQKHRLFTDNKIYIQYYFSSECVCLENMAFNQKAVLKNFSSINNLSDKIIPKLNQKVCLSGNKIDRSIIWIKCFAVSQLLDAFVNQFYADNVYLGNSIITKKQINKKILNNNMFLESFPYKGICFDGEGTYVNKKFILKDGQLIDLLSDIKFASYLNLNSAGNAGFTLEKKITHQMLKFYTSNKVNLEKANATLIIDSIENINIDIKNKTFTIIANCQDSDMIYRTLLSFDINKFFNNLFSTDEKFKLIDNVYCYDMVYKDKI